MLWYSSALSESYPESEYCNNDLYICQLLFYIENNQSDQ